MGPNIACINIQIDTYRYIDRLRTLAEAIMSALPAAGITVLAYGKNTKSLNREEKNYFRENYFSMLLWGTKELLHRKYNEFLTVYFYSVGLQALLAEGILDFGLVYVICHKVSKCKSDTTNLTKMIDPG